MTGLREGEHMAVVQNRIPDTGLIWLSYLHPFTKCQADEKVSFHIHKPDKLK